MKLTQLLRISLLTYLPNLVYSNDIEIKPYDKLSLPRPINGIPQDWSIQGNPTFGDQIAVLTHLDKGNEQTSLWTKDKNQFEEWTMEVTLSVSGPVNPGGAIALWYASTPNQVGSFHGSKETWDGLAITMDSLGWASKESDEASNVEFRGAIRGHLNDGRINYKSLSHIPDSSFSLCRINYRNTGAHFTIKVGYGKGSLIVEVNGQKCFETDEIILPKDYYFGVSASSTEKPDSFIIYEYNVYPALLPSLEKHIVKYHSDEKAGIHDKHDKHHNPAAPANPSNPSNPANPANAAASAVPPANPANPPTNLPDFNSIIESFKTELAKELSQHHNKLDAVNNINSKLSGIELRLDRMEQMFQELVRAQDSNIQSRYADLEKHISSEIGKTHAKLETIDKVVHDHTSNILGSFSETVNSAIDKGGYSVWALFVMVIIINGIIFVGYNVYKTRRSYHAKIL